MRWQPSLGFASLAPAVSGWPEPGSRVDRWSALDSVGGPGGPRRPKGRQPRMHCSGHQCVAPVCTAEAAVKRSDMTSCTSPWRGGVWQPGRVGDAPAHRGQLSRPEASRPWQPRMACDGQERHSCARSGAARQPCDGEARSELTGTLRHRRQRFRGQRQPRTVLESRAVHPLPWQHRHGVERCAL
jgi:hypothetical protein